MKTIALLCTAPLLGALGLGASPGTPADELHEIEAELREEMKLMRQAANELTAEGDSAAATEIYGEFYGTILPEYLERFAGVAREKPGTDAALEAWTLVITHGRSAPDSQPMAREALTALRNDHLDSQRLVPLCSMMLYGAQSYGEDEVLTTLRTFSTKSPHKNVQGASLFSLAALLSGDRPADDPRVMEARAIFVKLQADYGEEQAPDGRPMAEAAAGHLFSIDNLRVGSKCPDFEAVDAEGAKFKLSDYAGKVVLVDFWGFW